jgi:solute carrier family 13 (sodium-dependent dicarboxylate transporter), member 2/3/5
MDKIQSGQNNTTTPPEYDKPALYKRVFGMGGGLLIFTLMVLGSPPEGLSPEGWHTAAIAVLMATWWATEVIPIPVTALLPLVLFPVFNISGITAAAAPYANPMIFLFMGGFILAIGMLEWNLHRRIALNIIALIGSKPRSIILGFIIATAFISMWVSNAAATMMMLPIALSVIDLTRKRENTEDENRQYGYFAVALMLAVAYAANVGGLGTVIGTPTNALMIGFVAESYQVEISFLKWMLIGIPVVALGLPVIFYSLTYVTFPVKFKTLPGGREYIHGELKRLGGFSRGETMVAIVFGFTALLWMIRPLIERWLPAISDASIAIFGAVLLFLIPLDFRKGKFILTWKAASKLPWDILILFGGGFALAGGFSQSGLTTWIAGGLTVLQGFHPLLLIAIAALLVIFLTELTSNSATASLTLPVVAAVAEAMELHPLGLMVTVAIAASFAFMMPVATPPNAIVFSSRYITIPQMARVGLGLNLLGFAFLLLTIAVWLPWVWGLEIGQFPLEFRR